MVSPNPDNVRDVLSMIESWPSDDRLALARRILASMKSPVPPQSRRFHSLKELAGILATDDSPRAQEDYRKIRDEELIRKYLS